ncbi:MAG TPA: helix-turn-helix transcriptional regulator [Gemmatales bacterium]|nr:helix-turn-helix transcriptional regulator [Gemmatales bacterium]
MPKTHKPRARKDAIRLLREAKGWGQQALADRAVVSIKTINSVEQGKPAHLSTFAKIAKALGVEPSEFLDGYDPAAHLASDTIRALSKRVEVQIKLSIPFEEFDESDGLTNLVQMLSALIKARQEIGVVEVSPGSVKVTLEMHPDDLRELIAAFMEYRLKDAQVSSLEVLDPDFPMPDGLPREIDEQYRANWRYLQAKKDAQGAIPSSPSQPDSTGAPDE